jgi:hypothetical protein
LVERADAHRHDEGEDQRGDRARQTDVIDRPRPLIEESLHSAVVGDGS